MGNVGKYRLTRPMTGGTTAERRRIPAVLVVFAVVILLASLMQLR